MVAGEEDIGGIGAGEDGGEAEAGGSDAGEVLEAVDGGVDGADRGGRPGFLL
jgi:hypothetical protein